MAIKYRLIEGHKNWMTHVDRKITGDDDECYGCGEPVGRYVEIITDRSGSEYATAHRDRDDCVVAAMVRLDEDMYGEDERCTIR